jgi:hypothetical protein
VKATHKFNLARVGRQYERVDLEVEAATVDEATKEIKDAWQVYRNQVIEGKVQ